MQNNINTTVIQQVLNTIKAAESSRQPEIRIDINTAKTLSHTLGLVMTRLVGNYEGLINDIQKNQDNVVVNVEMDGGDWSSKE
jgi:hypothetical protein